MRTRICLIYMLFLSVVSAADPVIVRSSVSEKEAWRGQRVLLAIEVLAKDSWAQIPNMPALKVPGAYVIPPGSQSARAQDQIQGATYTGQRYQLSIYPQQGGTIRIPATEFQVAISNFGSGAEAKTQGAQIPAVEFTSKVPPGSEGEDWLVSTTQFEAKQSWSSDSTEWKVGDALKRSIRLSAVDVSGMAFAPLKFPSQNGLGIYPAEATVNDQGDRGRLSGSREETVTYVFQKAGTVELPAIKLVWWDVANEKLHSVLLGGRTIQVMGGTTAQPVSEQVTAVDRLLWGLVGALLALSAVLVWKRHALVKSYQRRLHERREREGIYFERFATVAATGDIRKTQGALMQWLDRINTTSSPAQLDLFLRRYAEGEWRTEELIQSPDELYQVLVPARKAWMKSQKVRKRAERLLPPLNVA